jgi:excisionase family DNA binding protein
MPTTKTTGTKTGKAAASTIMDDAPLFAGLADFILPQTENKKTEPPKTAPPQAKPAPPQTQQASTVRPLAQKTQKAPKTPKTPQPADPNAVLLSVTEMCSLLKISRATLIRMDKASKLPGRIKLGGSVRFHRETVEAWLKGLMTTPTP